MEALAQAGIEGLMLRWLEYYLSARTARVYMQGEYSDEVPVQSGVPQGSVISPVIFNMKSLISATPASTLVRAILYADDLALIANQHSPYKNMQSALNALC